MYNEKDFIKAIEASFRAYKEKGARSTAKLKPIHKFVADTLTTMWGAEFNVRFMGDGNTEATIEGKYYPKDIDITIMQNGTAVFCLGIKFVTSNYKQNANNYFENMMGGGDCQYSGSRQPAIRPTHYTAPQNTILQKERNQNSVKN